MTQKYVQTPAVALYSPMSGAATSCVIAPYPRDIQTNRKLTFTDFGSSPTFTVDPGVQDYEEINGFTGITDNGDDTATLTGLTRNLIGEDPYTTTGTGKQHGSSAVIVFSNNPQGYARLASKENDNTFEGLNIFEQAPQSEVDPVSNDDLARKSWIMTLVLGVLTTINVIIPGTAGATIAAGNLIYLDTADGKWKLCDADTPGTVNNVLLAIAQGAGTNGNAIANGVLIQGIDTHQSGLTPGSIYYASNTAGGISVTPGTTEVTVGAAKSATELLFAPRFDQQITEDQQDALVGTEGTPSSSNPYATKVTTDKKISQSGAQIYAATATGNDTYVITLSPVPSALVAGMVIWVKADVGNTGAASLNPNLLGPITIKKNVSSDLETGDILAGQVFGVVYDGTNFQLITTVPSSITETLYNGVPNTNEAANTYYTYQVPILFDDQSATNGNVGWINTNIADATGFGAGGAALIQASGNNAGIISPLPGTGSVFQYRASANKSIKIKGRFRLEQTSGVKSFGMVASVAGAYAAETGTLNAVRFVENAGTFYAQNANGATATSTDISSGVTRTNWNTFEIVFTPGTNIKYYINGTLKATHTTNLPADGTDLFLGIGLSATGHGITMFPMTISLEM